MVKITHALCLNFSFGEDWKVDEVVKVRSLYSQGIVLFNFVSAMQITTHHYLRYYIYF